MIPHLRRHFSLAAAASLQLLAATSAAHIELQVPMNRYSNIRAGENKACPCGSGVTSRRCNDPEQLSDTDRSLDRITTFAPGETITVRFDEYVGHDGRYRIAFDPDGAELEDFNQHILLDEPDPAGNGGNSTASGTGDRSTWEFQVTLPNMTCDNCTLQLIQVMDGNTVDPVLDPATRGGTYFQCADLVLAEGTPAGGIPPANPSEHFAERRRAERAPTERVEPTDTELTDAEPADTEPASAPMTVSPGGQTPVASNGNEPMSSASSYASSNGNGACSLPPSHPARSGLPGLALLTVAMAALRSRRRAR